MRANSSQPNMEQKNIGNADRSTPNRKKALPAYKQNYWGSTQNHHQIGGQNNLILMSASDATTQRNHKYHTMVNSAESMVNQKLPIISTRKTHFAID